MSCNCTYEMIEDCMGDIILGYFWECSKCGNVALEDPTKSNKDPDENF